MKVSYSDMRDFQADPRAYHYHSASYRQECHRAAKRAVWSWRWRVVRQHVILLLAATLLAFAIICGIIALGSWAYERNPRPHWNERQQRWECPAGTDVYADEDEAMAGRSFVHCVK